MGLWHKTGEILAVAVCSVGEHYKGTLGLNGVSILIPVCAYICIMEFISIIENLCELNPALAKFFTPYLQKLNQNESEDNKNGKN